MLTKTELDGFFLMSTYRYYHVLGAGAIFVFVLNLTSGIVQSDLLIRQAIIAGLAEMRRQTWIIEYALSWLDDDDLTSQEYGRRVMDREKAWFQKTNIPVRLAYTSDAPVNPCITVQLLECSEESNSLGDVDVDPIQVVDEWPALTAPFNPLAYETLTGRLEFPASVLDVLVIVPGMSIVTREGRSLPIVSVEEDVAILAPGTVADLRGCVIKGTNPSRLIQREAAFFNEAYEITIQAGEASHLMTLFTLVLTTLLRGRQDLLEARGFGESVVTSGPIETFQGENGPSFFVRSIRIQGRVRQTWPKRMVDLPQAMVVRAFMGAPGNESTSYIAENAETDPWFPQTG